MKPVVAILSISLLILMTLLVFPRSTMQAAPGQPTQTPIPGAEPADQVSQAINEAVQAQQEAALAYLVNDVVVQQVEISDDRDWAVGWLSMADKQTGEVIPAEPGLAIAHQTQSGWDVFLPTNPVWEELLKLLPQDLLDPWLKQIYLEMNAQYAPVPYAVYAGYRLPWAAGQTAWLSGSTAHDSYIPSGNAHYAFDFYVPQTMFRLYAAKAGVVWWAKWDVPNGDSSGTGNYLILQDNTTSPVTYQLYLHLAQDSIPASLRQRGAYVVQGQYIGMADDTGQSTGHHLHYQVHTNPDSYWGRSVDITFEDVDINGGRPRVKNGYYNDQPYCDWPGDVCNEFRSAYVSGNVVHGDITPPTAGLFEPATGTTVTAGNLHIEGWASDVGSGLDEAYLIASYEDSWHAISPSFSSLTFSWDWDLCADGVPDGPLSLAVRAWDNDGNPAAGMPGLTHLTKDFSCDPPPPACVPGPEGAAIFSGTDFTGKCQLLGTGTYNDSSDWGQVEDEDIQSLLTGSNVVVTLYSGENLSARGDTYLSGDANLADNLVGSNTTSSLVVYPRSTKPKAPATLIQPGQGSSWAGGSSLSFSWRDPGAASGFQVQLDGPSVSKTSPWLSEPYWNLSNQALPAGSYTWKVRARNCTEAGCAGPWSQASTFTITPPTSPPPATTTPFIDTVENGANGWAATGRWNRRNDASRAYSGAYSWYFGDPALKDYQVPPHTGDLTSRPIAIPASPHLLTFWYRFETENSGTHWDQRWVQISADGEPYQNLLLLKDDELNEWLRATLDLAPYAGKTIRVRFHFTALDDVSNDFEGWYIDNVEIKPGFLPSCADSDNSPEQATPFGYDQEIAKEMCPFGDIDYFTFTAQAGDRIVADIDTPIDNRPDGLDLVLYLLDNDGKSVLAMHDDEVTPTRLDPHLGYRINRSGTYFLKAKLWSHPTRGGEAYDYRLRLSRDGGKPAATFLSPESGEFTNSSGNLDLQVEATDEDSGIAKVEFLYHSGNWVSTGWQVLGKDVEGGDGWSMSFDASDLSEQTDLAFYANVYDWAGNWTGTGAWEIGIDRTPPDTSLEDLDDQQSSTAVLLRWTASDNLSGLDYFDLQSQAGSGSWNHHSPDPDGASTKTWFIGNPGTNYGFRMRGVDRADNAEDYPSSAETRTYIPGVVILCSSPDTWDTGRNDNSPQAAVVVNVNSQPRTHNFCNPLVSSRENDEDWIKFSVIKGKSYMLRADPIAGMAAANLYLYAANGSTLIKSAEPTAFGEPTLLSWIADRDGLVYLQSRHPDGRVIGSAVTYQLAVREVLPIFFPIVNR